MIRCVVIDDEQRSRETICELLKHYPDVEVVGEAGNVEDAVRVIQKCSPGLIFLDIEMPPETGFDLLDRLQDFTFKVIFTTAHSHYAVKAIRYKAFDYLVKPLDVGELRIALQNVLASPVQQTADPSPHKNRGIRLHKQKLFLSTTNGVYSIDIAKIIRLEADRNYTKILVQDSTAPLLISKTLKDFEIILDQQGFYRVHQSHLVNIDHVSRYVRGKGSKLFMSDQSVVEVSRNKREEFLNIFMQNERSV